MSDPGTPSSNDSTSPTRTRCRTIGARQRRSSGNERTSQWFLNRFSDVHETMRRRGFGRVDTHRCSHADIRGLTRLLLSS